MATPQIPQPAPAGPFRDPAGLVLAASRFAAHKHRHQRRKGEEGAPYIHHCIEVAHTLAEHGGVTDPEVLAAALLHDTLEDTETTADEIEREFGARVRGIVEEVSDDRTLTRERRRALQIEHAPSLSEEAKLIKLADKICNVGDVAYAPPRGWSRERRVEYVDWTAQVVEGCRAASARLAEHYDRRLKEVRRVLGAV